MKSLVQTVLHPVVWVWWFMSDTKGGIWLPQFKKPTEDLIFNFIKKYGYKLGNGTYSFCGIVFASWDEMT